MAGEFGESAGPFQAIFQQGGDNRVAFKHPDPKAGGGKEKTVASEAGGGVDEQGLRGFSHLGRLDQQFPAGMARASAGGWSGKIDP